MELKQSEPFLAVLQRCYATASKTLLACSGGPDSTALFFLLLQLKEQRPDFDFEVFHLNHGIRATDALRDEEFIQKLCERFGIILHKHQENIPELAKRNGLSLEEAGRECRYRKMEEIREKRHLESIATAHHADDQIELFLMRLFTGGGPAALSGMREKRGFRIKPLLSFSKSQILNFLSVNHLEFCVDETNTDLGPLRNRIRHEILPRVKGLFPSAEQKILQFQWILKERESWINDQLIPWERNFHEVFLSHDRFLSLNSLIRKDQILKGLKKFHPNFYLGYENLKRIEERIALWKGQGHEIFIKTKNFVFLGSYGQLFFIDADALEKQDLLVQLYPRENFQLFSLKLINTGKSPFLLRRPFPGERICFSKTKKIQDFLVDLKVHFHRRPSVFVVEQNGQMVALADPLGRQYWVHERFVREAEFKICVVDPAGFEPIDE